MSAAHVFNIPPGLTWQRRIEWKAGGVPVNTDGFEAEFIIKSASGAELLRQRYEFSEPGVLALRIEAGASGLWSGVGAGCYYLRVYTPSDIIGLMTGLVRFTERFSTIADGVIVVQNEKITVLTVGLQGPPGPSGGASYRHRQDSPAATWSILHNLGRRPAAVMAVDGFGDQIFGSVRHFSADEVRIDFALPLSGEAFLN